jgi:hypothetical protein
MPCKDCQSEFDDLKSDLQEQREECEKLQKAIDDNCSIISDALQEMTKLL